MRGNELLDKMELVHSAYIDAADEKPAGKKHPWRKWAAAAACLCLIIAAIPFFANKPSTPHGGIDAEFGPPHIVIDNIKYYISAHLSASNELPDGFVAAGNIDIDGGYENCPYYLNPDIPEWVYVYHEVRTNGNIDETGTLINTPPHNAYVRYVDERLRNACLVCFNGKYYISMWSADCYGDNPDVTKEYYDKIYSMYGVRMEGAVPHGFELAGTAVFTGDDTVPKGMLASNEAEAAVYFNPDDPSVILVETHWFTATAQENGQTRHDGYDVYILYDCPFITEAETIQFHDKSFNRSDLSQKTIEWLEWYNGLTQDEQLSISSIPSDLYKLYGFPDAETIDAGN